jgi:aspartate carbamoyltransferase catalytic subunit
MPEKVSSTKRAAKTTGKTAGAGAVVARRAGKSSTSRPFANFKKAVPVAKKLPVAEAAWVHPGSLVSVVALDVEEISRLMRLAYELDTASVKKRARQLEGRRAALLFYESSTRTRTSFELAAKQLGATTTLVSDKSSSIEKGESLKDTGITLRALGAECIILRHAASGAAVMLARFTGLPVLNAGDGSHEHPTQALLDLRTMLAHGLGGVNALQGKISATTLAGKTIVIAGDILHSRVARSNALLLPKLGAQVILCGPEALLPETAAEIGPGVRIERDFNTALKQADAVMMLRIQKERLAGLELDLAEYIAGYQLHQERLAAYAPKALVMHPGPIIRGLELTAEVADGKQSVIEEQVHHGVAVRMAALVRALDAKHGKKAGKKHKGDRR